MRFNINRWQSISKPKYIVFFIGAFVFTAGFVFFVGTQILYSAPDPDPHSPVVHNVSPLELTFILETETGEEVELGTVPAGESHLFPGKLPLEGEDFTLHAKDQRGFEFFTLLIDWDELIQRNMQVTIPGPQGRRIQQLLPPTSVPMPTSTP